MDSGDRQTAELAFGLAVLRADWYTKAARRAMIANTVTHFAVLVVGAGTIVAAAVGREPLLTASLAAASFLLTGARSYFDWAGLTVTRTVAREEMQAAIDRYLIRPGPERQDPAISAGLLDEIHEIATTERAAWLVLRRLAAAREPGAASGADQAGNGRQTGIAAGTDSTATGVGPSSSPSP